MSDTGKQKSNSSVTRVRQNRFMSSEARVDSKAAYIDNALRAAYYCTYTGSEPEPAFSD